MRSSKIRHKFLKCLVTYQFLFYFAQNMSLNKFRNFKQILITHSVL